MFTFHLFASTHVFIIYKWAKIKFPFNLLSASINNKALVLGIEDFKEYRFSCNNSISLSYFSHAKVCIRVFNITLALFVCWSVVHQGSTLVLCLTLIPFREESVVVFGLLSGALTFHVIEEHLVKSKETFFLLVCPPLPFHLPAQCQVIIINL